jgi:hypothetical protein
MELSCVGVTIDGVCIYDSIYWSHIHSRLVTTLYRSLTHTSVLSLLQSPLAISWRRILTQELWQSHCIRHAPNITYKVFSLQPAFQLSILATKRFLHSVPYKNWLSTNWVASGIFKITPRHGPHRKRLFYCRGVFTKALRSNGRDADRRKHPVSNSTSIVARRFVAAGKRLPRRCLEMSQYIRLARGRRIATAPHGTVRWLMCE